ncbi:hypothetical protein Pla123a_20220 [Posidoniimonas polymericola]|uniref:Autotransporter-associated beta strand repeat protein n=1 Tax=Posidoniimonas polymericola TaxID=2528002 RepID=A0A5C5YQZ8_9BACT|nr:hypothetical protein [Posidoniimonas polymericola]TWT77361.1 hypothetical protein Pla123a_20220 [Posidoniimonas polymericola]
MPAPRNACFAATALLLLTGAAWGFEVPGEAVINVPPDPTPSVLTAGQTLNLSGELYIDLDDTLVAQSGSVVNFLDGSHIEGGGYLFAEAGSVANLYGGTLYDYAGFAGELNVFGGGYFGYQASNTDQVLIAGGDNSVIFDNVGARMTGGEIYLIAGNGSTFEMQGGALKGIESYDELIVNITGGEILGGGFLGSDTKVTISGGLLADPRSGSFEYAGSGVLSLVGSDFAIDGLPLPRLAPGEAIEIPQRGVELTATLQDGSPFTYPLNWPDQTYRVVGGVPTPGGLALLGPAALFAMRRSFGRERAAP